MLCKQSDIAVYTFEGSWKLAVSYFELRKKRGFPENLLLLYHVYVRVLLSILGAAPRKIIRGLSECTSRSL